MHSESRKVSPLTMIKCTMYVSHACTIHQRGQLQSSLSSLFTQLCISARLVKRSESVRAPSIMTKCHTRLMARRGFRRAMTLLVAYAKRRTSRARATYGDFPTTRRVATRTCPRVAAATSRDAAVVTRRAGRGQQRGICSVGPGLERPTEGQRGRRRNVMMN